MTNLLLVLAIGLALAAMARRRSLRSRLDRLARERPGSSAALAIPITGFDEMDDHLRLRRCPCGGYLERRGEGSRDVAGTSYRVARLECLDCERVDEVFFDTAGVLH
jgi:hypothetical protein